VCSLRMPFQSGCVYYCRTYYKTVCDVGGKKTPAMKKPPETATIRDYAITAINKYLAMKFKSSYTAQYQKTAETTY